MNEIFARKTDELRRESVPENVEGVNNECPGRAVRGDDSPEDRYFPKWLGPLFVGVYVAVDAPSVFNSTISLGTFLATMQVMKDISSEFAEAGSRGAECLRRDPGVDGHFRVHQIFDCHVAALVFFNKSTDLLMWKKVNRQRREATWPGEQRTAVPQLLMHVVCISRGRQARDELFKNPSPDEHNKSEKATNMEAVYKTDLIKIRFLGCLEVLMTCGDMMPAMPWPRIDAMTFGWVEDKDGVRQNVLTTLGAWIGIMLG
eukprot:Skav221189  [mRNA]  locus=scaffold1504:285825:289405:- [translate_table: standard]